MTDLSLTRHAERRMRQRGLRDNDLLHLLGAATPVGDDAWLVTNADVTREIARCKREIEQLQRLRGCKIVISCGVVVTIYHASPAERRRSLRQGRERR